MSRLPCWLTSRSLTKCPGYIVHHVLRWINHHEKPSSCEFQHTWGGESHLSSEFLVVLSLLTVLLWRFEWYFIILDVLKLGEEILKLFPRKVIESLGLERSPDNTRFVGGSKKSYWSKFLIKNFSCICAAVLKILKSSKQEGIFSVCLTIRGRERGVEWVCQSPYCSPGPPCSKVTFYIKALIQYTKRIF